MTQPGFDPRDGTLSTDFGDVLGPGFTRAAFLGSGLAADATTLIVNEPHASWTVARSMAARPFRFGLYFEGEQLTMVVAALDDPAYGRNWSEWTPERELARKAAHDAWLAAIDPEIGDGREFPWGFVASILDEKSGGSEILIRYGSRLPERASSPYPPIAFAGPRPT